MQQFVKFILLKVNGKFAVSWFLTCSIVLPAINIIKSFFVISMNIKMIFFLIFDLLFFYLIFVLFPSIYYKIVDNLFSKNIIKRKKIFFFGALLLRDSPFSLGFYIFLSISSFYLINEYPNNLYIHIFHVLCVCFRNIFMTPCAEFASLVALNKKKQKLLENRNSNYQDKIPLFSDTVLSDNKIFCKKVEILSMVVSNLKPSAKSTIKTTWFSFPTSLFWLTSLQIKKSAEQVFKLVKENQKQLQQDISHLLQNNEQCCLKQLAFAVNEKMTSVSDKLLPYKNMNSLELSVHFLLKNQEFLKIQNLSFDILRDSIILKYLSEVNIKREKIQCDLINLAQKYKPELIPDLQKKFINLEKASQVFNIELISILLKILDKIFKFCGF